MLLWLREKGRRQRTVRGGVLHPSPSARTRGSHLAEISGDFQGWVQDSSSFLQ